MTQVQLTEHTEAPTIAARIVSRRALSTDVVELELDADADGGLAAWGPGDHLDVVGPAGTRQYSLCGTADARTWTIAVLREGAVSGWLHGLGVGDVVRVGSPRSTFVLRAGEAPTLLVGAGIGITPILAMRDALTARGAQWRMIAIARGPQPFAARLAGDDRVTTWDSASAGRFDLSAAVAATPAGTEVYACGPAALLDALADTMATLGRTAHLHVERFRAVEVDSSADEAFELELRRSGLSVVVPADRSALEVIGEAGVFLPSSCREGICGSCEAPVLEGEIDHRDAILDAGERAANDCMFPCVSRAQCRVVLDL